MVITVRDGTCWVGISKQAKLIGKMGHIPKMKFALEYADSAA